MTEELIKQAILAGQKLVLDGTLDYNALTPGQSLMALYMAYRALSLTTDNPESMAKMEAAVDLMLKGCADEVKTLRDPSIKPA